jgi:tetratricopeptide (TPR) repeat protein
MTETSEKSVFISYRRSSSSYIARAIFQNLSDNGYDVFIDVENIANGAFDTVILNEVARRPHFILILAPGAVERFISPDDWMRREIELAMELQHNLVPVLVTGFDFADTEKYLTGKLSGLSRYNSLQVYHDYFDEAMNRLRDKFLNRTGPNLKDTSPLEYIEPRTFELEDEQHGGVPSVTHLVVNADLHYARGIAREKRGELEQAIENYEKALLVDPKHSLSFFGRAHVNYHRKHYEDALADFTKAIHLKPELSLAYLNRGKTYFCLKHYELAMSDLRKANDLLPGDPATLVTLAVTSAVLGDRREAERIWRILVLIDENYKDAEWLSEHVDWNDTLVAAGKAFTATLK